MFQAWILPSIHQVVGVPSVSKSPQSGDHHYGRGMWQVSGAWLTNPQCFLLVTSGHWLLQCCLTGSRLFLEVQQQRRCWGRAGFSGKMLLLLLTLCQAIVGGLRPDPFTTTALVGMAVDAKPPASVDTVPVFPLFHLPYLFQCFHLQIYQGSLRCVWVLSRGSFVGL